jgi:hypothetical protein
MKKTILFMLLFVFVSKTQAQHDTARYTKTTTQSTASYQFASSFEISKTESVKNYLVAKFGNYEAERSSEFSWPKVSVFENYREKASVILKPGNIEITWKTIGNETNSAPIIKKLEGIAAEISKLIK